MTLAAILTVLLSNRVYVYTVNNNLNTESPAHGGWLVKYAAGMQPFFHFKKNIRSMNPNAFNETLLFW